MDATTPTAEKTKTEVEEKKPEAAEAEKVNKPSDPNRKTGKVVKFHSGRGYGFIECDGIQYFAHQSKIKVEGFRSLKIGTTVEFLPKQVAGKMQAMEITGLNGKEPEKADRPQDNGGFGQGNFNSGGKGVCFDFQKGRCSRGAQCRFSHPPGAGRGGPPRWSPYGPPMQGYGQQMWGGPPQAGYGGYGRGWGQ